MAQSNGAFTLTINSNSGFGETGKPHIEQQQIRRLLSKVAQEIGSGRPSSHIFDDSGNDVGSYAYGSGMINSGR